MSKLGQGLTATGFATLATIGVLALRGTTLPPDLADPIGESLGSVSNLLDNAIEATMDARQAALQPGEVSPTLVPWACPTMPEAPPKVGCWVTGGKQNVQYLDCTDPSKMGICKYVTYSISGKILDTREEACPLCLAPCVSALNSAHDVALADYEFKAVKCPAGMVGGTGSRCLCLADKFELPPDAVDINTIPSTEKKILYGCDNSRQNGWRSANLSAPMGCTALSGPIASVVSMVGIETELDRDLGPRCAPYPIYPGDHGHCPWCLRWKDGCPPCRKIAEIYGANWKGHEDKCQ